ncbi:MAG TPA: Na/Pi cotransporter family protein [Spirochaetota bacterium]|nr:Na/Pi cotransporter family protein [Spirochaetota bacterium]
MQLTNIILIFGSLGIFIYGMKLLSESLETAAGDGLKKILSSLTGNRFLGVLTGFVLTSIIQSSSATTVMVVSFVNAGLLSLVQAIGVIMGANIGTTVTAWLVNLTNMKINMTMIAYLSIIVGILLVFAKNKKINMWGYCLLGFGFIFVGLDVLKNAVPKPTADNSNFLYSFFQMFPHDNYFVLLFFVLFGTVLTMVLQSSSVTMAFTIMILNQGYITMEIAAAMCLGENIGTTITANLAALAGNKMAKKAALSHTLFNVFGVLWMMIPFVFNFYLYICKNISSFLPFFTSGAEYGVQLAVFHSLFNITNTLLLIWFIDYIAFIVEKIYGKEKTKIKKSYLKIDAGIIRSPELALFEIKQEINKISKISRDQFKHINDLINNKGERKSLFNNVQNMAKEISEYEDNINIFLNKLLEESEKGQTVDTINKLMNQIKFLEWTSHSCMEISKIIKKVSENEIDIQQKNQDNFKQILLKINQIFDLVILNISNVNDLDIITKVIDLKDETDVLYKKMKKETIALIKRKATKKTVPEALLFLDIIRELEHIGDFLKNMIVLSSDLKIEVQ